MERDASASRTSAGVWGARTALSVIFVVLSKSMSAIDAEEANALAYSLEIPGNPSIYIGWWQVNYGGIGVSTNSCQLILPQLRSSTDHVHLYRESRDQRGKGKFHANSRLPLVQRRRLSSRPAWSSRPDQQHHTGEFGRLCSNTLAIQVMTGKSLAAFEVAVYTTLLLATPLH